MSNREGIKKCDCCKKFTNYPHEIQCENGDVMIVCKGCHQKAFQSMVIQLKRSYKAIEKIRGKA